MEKRKQAVANKLGVKKNSGVVKKSKAAVNKAATLAGRASEAAQGTATAVKEAATAAVQSVQKVPTAVEERSKQQMLLALHASAAACAHLAYTVNGIYLCRCALHH